jgi:hypothetical protein
MRILAFLSKSVGRRCAEFLLRTFPDDDYRFLVDGPDADEIVAWLSGAGKFAERLDAKGIKDIEAEPENSYDWLLNLWGSQIFRPPVLTRARLSLNIHPSLLPLGRGRDPVVWTVRNGWPAGVSLHQISPTVDAGDIWYQEVVPYKFPIRGGELYERVVSRSWQVFCEQWPALRGGHVTASPQPCGAPTFRRSQLFPDRRLTMDENPMLEGFIRRLLAHDFSDSYTAQIVIDGRVYAATLSLKAAPTDQNPNS